MKTLHWHCSWQKKDEGHPDRFEQRSPGGNGRQKPHPQIVLIGEQLMAENEIL